jgi:hypothetical protein
LLFQVLRDDFLSLWVRGCWLVSFFFTPIYMLMLVFFAMFGVKKGSIVAYRSLWNFSFKDQCISIVSHFAQSYKPYNVMLKVFRLNFTAITSRSTSYLLLSFWLFFFWSGELLLLTLFNYTTIADSIQSNSFLTVKAHTILMLSSLSSKLQYDISCFIFFLTSCSIAFLINVNYVTAYNYFRSASIVTVTPFLILLWISM